MYLHVPHHAAWPAHTCGNMEWQSMRDNVAVLLQVAPILTLGLIGLLGITPPLIHHLRRILVKDTGFNLLPPELLQHE